MFGWLSRLFKKTQPTQSETKTKKERKLPKINVYIHDGNKLSWTKEKISALIKEEKIEENEALLVSFYTSQLKGHFSNLKISLFNPWSLKKIKEKEKFLKYKIIVFDEFCDDLNGIFYELIKFLSKRNKIIFGVVNTKEFESEACKKFKKTVPVFCEPIVINQKLASNKEDFEEDALFSNNKVSDSETSLDDGVSMGGLY